MSALKASQIPGVSLTSKLIKLKAAVMHSGDDGQKTLSLKILQPVLIYTLALYI